MKNTVPANMDSSKVYKLIHKLQRKYGVQSKMSPEKLNRDASETSMNKCDEMINTDAQSEGGTIVGVSSKDNSCEEKSDSLHVSEEEPGGLPVDWCLTDRYGQRQRLPKTMIFLGREECDIILQSETVDKRHAVVTFDHYLNKFKIKDLSTTNGTYVNDNKIAEQTYVTLEHLDSVRLGFDPASYYVERMDKLGGGGLPAVIPQGKPPAWASRHLTHMAECKGCIAEQQIQHTCGVHMPHDPRHEVPHHHLACHHHSAAPDLNGLEDISGYNTWPRKGERLKMQPPVQKEVLPPLSSDQTSSSKCSDVTSDSSSTTHSSISAMNAKTKGVPSDCVPRDAIQGASANAKPVMYVDSDSNHSQFSKDATDNNIMKPERDTNSTKKSEVDGKISADLKSSDVKGTPLYGQPSWWGEEDGATMLPVSNGTRPELKSMDMSLKSSQSEMDWGYDPQKYKSDPKYSQRYMEIPARDTDPGLESPIAQHESNTSVLSRDSLSPEDSPLKPSKEQSAEIDSAEKTNALPKTDSGGALAFTVDLGDEKPSKKMNMTGSLSEFVPSKIRRSFRERSEKATSKAPKDEPQRDVKDSASQQRKLDELWGYGEERGDADERLPAEGRFVLNSDGEEDDHVQIQHPAYGKKGAKSGDPESTRLIPAVDSSTYKKPRPGSGQFIRPIHPTADVPLSDPASFLIDKMFETCPPSTSKAERADLDVIPQVTEHALYKESSHHDPGSKSSRSQKNNIDIAELKPRKSGLEPQSTKTRPVKQRRKENVIDAEEGDNDDHLDVTHDIDKTSEAGTYTIEQDEAAAAKAEEEKEARQSIDRVFGVGRDGLLRPVVGCNISSVSQSEVNGVSNGTDDGSPDRDDVSPDRDDVGSVGQLEHVEEDLERLEWQRAGDGAVLSSMEVEVGSGYDRDGLANNNNKLAVGPPGPLIKQRTFLKEPPSQPSPDSSKSSSSKDSLNSINMSPSDRPPSGSQRKRPGTGRKLPSLPPDKSSPRSDSSPRLSDIVQRSKDYSPRGVNSGRDSPSRKDKSVTISGKVMTHEARLDSTRSDDVTLTNVSSLSADSSQIFVPIRNKKESARSLASIDTEILLRDTETVMAAMEARMVSRERARQSGEFDLLVNCDSDTDASSTVAVVNSDNTPGNTVRAVRQGAVRQGSKSAGQRLTRGRSQEKPSQIPRQDSVPKERQSPITLASLTRKLSLPSGPDRSVVSDIMSDGDDSLSIRSDASTDFSESSPMQARKGSKGKGNITMTRPNRAFQLRRLRAEGSTESPEHTKSEASSVTTSTPKSRPVSGRTGSRPSSTGFPSDRKSDASLGTAIAQKGKQNAAKDQQNFARKDGGRHSLRSQRSTTSTQSSASSRSSGYTRSTASASPSSARSTTSTTTTTRSSLSGSTSTTKTSTPESARKKELRDLKTHLKGKPDLTVMGVSQKSRSQPPSRSNSPKSQERNAWKRRKEYDPRKAVAQAKAKAKALPNPPGPNGSKTKATPTSMQKGLLRMARSASYTNPDDFNKFGRESLGREAMGDSMSSDDLNVELKEEAPKNFDGSRFRQPLKSRGAKSMSNIRDPTGHHSGDENSSSVSEESTDVALYSYGMLGIRPYKSAFTPPPKSSLSPASPPFSPPFRRPHNSHDLYCTQSVPRLANRHSDTHSQSQSYDNLIISSIYQLSLKLKTSTDRTLEKLRDNRRVSGSPSPVFELNSQATAGEIPAWNAANQELAAILKNLRKMDHRMQVINKALFPTEEGAGTESARLTSREKKQYLQEIQRIHELAGFRPIENPEQDWRAEGNDCTEDIEDNTSNVSEIEDFVEEDFY